MIIKPIIDTSKELAGGKYTIRIYIYDKATKKKRYVSTKEPFRVEQKYWDGDKVHKSHPNYMRINSELKKICMELESRWLKNPKISIDELIRDPEESPMAAKITLAQFMDQYMDWIRAGKILTKKGQPISEDFVEVLDGCVKRINKFFEEKGARDFKDIDEDFYAEFVTWMRYDCNFSENTIGKIIKNLKRIMKAAGKKGLHNNLDYQDFAVPEMETFQIALSKEEIEAMASLDLPIHLANEMDRFYVSYNFLLRFRDSIIIDERDIITKNGSRMLKTTPHKTHNEVIIPFLPRTYDILKKHDFKLPKSTTQESNWKIKEIAKLAKITEPTTVTEIRKKKVIKHVYPRHDLVTTHTARRSMATNLFEAGFPIPQIQIMGGWLSISSFQRYLRLDKMKNATVAAEHPFFKRSIEFF